MEELFRKQGLVDPSEISSFSKEEFFSLANSCEKAGRFVDMALVLVTYLSSIPPSTKIEAEERTLLSLAFKGVVKPLRHGILSCTETIKHLETTESVRKTMSTVREGLMLELEIICSDLIQLVNKVVLNESAFQDADCLIWAYKTVGDHRRYEAELFLAGRESKAESMELAETAYSQGLSEAQTLLKPTSILRLSLALNYVSFCFEIMKDPKKARDIGQEAIDSAETEITSLNIPNSSLPDTDHIIRLIRVTLQDLEKAGVSQ